LKVIDVGQRPADRTVLAAARYGDVAVYFHDDRAYLEAGGFWTRGMSRVTVSAALPETAAAVLPLRLRSGGGPLPVRVETPAWSTRLIVGSDAATMVSVRHARASAWCRWPLPPRMRTSPPSTAGLQAIIGRSAAGLKWDTRGT
jgi:hypothetical protein